MDILGTEKETLPVLDDMGHVIVRAIAPVPNVDIPDAGEDSVSANDGTEGPELVLVMDGLENGVGIDPLFQVIKGVKVNTLKAFRGMALADKVLRPGKLRFAKKGKRGAVGGQKAVTPLFFHGRDGRGKVTEDAFQGGRP